ESVPLTIVDDIIPFTVGEAIAVLDRDDRDNFASAVDMFLSNVRQCNESNLPFVSQLSQCFHRRIEGDDRIGNMQLINIDAVQSQSLEAPLDSFQKVRGSRIVGPLIGTWAIPAAFGSDHEAARVGIQRFGDQFLTDKGPGRIRRIDEIDVEFDRTAQNRQRSLAILWRTPDSFACEAHGSKAETTYGKFAAECYLASQPGRNVFAVHDSMVLVDYFHWSSSNWLTTCWGRP